MLLIFAVCVQKFVVYALAFQPARRYGSFKYCVCTRARVK